MKKRNFLFLFSIMVIYAIIGCGSCYNIFSYGLNYFSTIENRHFAHFEDVKFNNFFNGNLQNNLENSLSDQFYRADELRLKYYDNLLFLDYRNIPKYICKNKYVKVGSLFASFNCDDLFMYRYDKNFYNDVISKIENNLIIYNEINKLVDSYYYYIPTGQGYDFENNIDEVDIKYYFDQYFDSDYTYFELDSRNYYDYQKYFYKTDHHWNQDGSYKAYSDIITTMTGEKPKEISKRLDLTDANFYGTLARLTKYFDIKESFFINYVDIGKYSLKVNDIEEEMRHIDTYIAGDYSTYDFFNHYSYLNGYDEKLKVYDFNNPSKENILIFSNSYGTAVNHLIASHFNKTHVMDFRHIDEKINIKDYIEDNNITKLLVVMDYWLFQTEINNMEVE